LLACLLASCLLACLLTCSLSFCIPGVEIPKSAKLVSVDFAKKLYLIKREIQKLNQVEVADQQKRKNITHYF
jgi:hypothetical protein